MDSGVTISRCDDGTLVDVWVVPGAKREEIVGEHDGALRVRVVAPPQGGRANAAVAALLKREFGASDVYLHRGALGRRKQFVLVGVSPAAVRAKLLG